MHKLGAVAAVVAAVVAAAPRAYAQHEGHGAMADSAAVAQVVIRYHAALAAGDSAAALALLSDDALILESGGIETRAEYRAHHLPADMRAAQSRPAQRSPIRVTIRGDVAWAASTSTPVAESGSQPGSSSSAELMVMVKTAQGWRIAAIHWSSRRRA